MFSAIDGSSPPTRGTRVADCAAPRDARFIPAYAGNTVFWRVMTPPNPVHPRLRGEHGLLDRTSSTLSGSSPPTRGTRRVVACPVRWRRFIPAYAGNTFAQGCALDK